MTSTASGPGLLYVNSKITSNDLSPELFTEWYEDVHIPDIFETSGIKSAFRYYTRSPEPTKVDRPYLALYPLNDVGFLYTQEFKSIPVHSDMLPVESKNIFDLADFDTRYYIKVGTVDGNVDTSDPLPFIAVGQLHLPSDLRGKSDADILSWYTSQNLQGSSSRTTMYRVHFARQNRLPPEQNTLQQPLELLILYECGTEEDMDAFLQESLTKNAASFKLLKAFGDTKRRF